MKFKNLFIPLAAIIFGLAALTFLNTNFQYRSSPSTAIENVQKFKVNQTIIYGGVKPDETIEVEAEGGDRVLDILLRTKEVEVKEYSFGKLVESIQGIKNGLDNKYWIFYVNGEEAKVGASEYQLKPDDKIEWKFKIYEQ